MTSSLGWVEKLTGHYILCLDSAVPANGPEVTEKAKHYFFTWEKLGLSEHVPCFVLLFLFVFACFFFFRFLEWPWISYIEKRACLFRIWSQKRQLWKLFYRSWQLNAYFAKYNELIKLVAPISKNWLTPRLQSITELIETHPNTPARDMHTQMMMNHLVQDFNGFC